MSYGKLRAAPDSHMDKQTSVEDGRTASGLVLEGVSFENKKGGRSCFEVRQSKIFGTENPENLVFEKPRETLHLKPQRSTSGVKLFTNLIDSISCADGEHFNWLFIAASGLSPLSIASETSGIINRFLVSCPVIDL